MTYIIGLDLETTGLDYSKGDRIIEFCGQVYKFESRQKILDLTMRISNDGQSINKKAEAVHKISAVDLIGKPKFADVAPKIDAILKRAQAVVAHNGFEFDVPFLAHEMNKAGLPFPSNIFIIDTMVEGMFASYDTKPPSLQELCWALDVEYDTTKAHAAQYDVDVMMEAYFKGVDYGYFDASMISAEAA